MPNEEWTLFRAHRAATRPDGYSADDLGGGFCKSRTMHFVGVDLAWGVRRPTGLAVLDDDGRLLHVASESSDDAIAAALAPYVAGECLVAIDAPLVVTNATGNRPAEAELNRDFRAFEAGAHPTNTGKPEFRDGPRGGRLAERLGLDLDPGSEGGRRAIEVYPHAAIVALFRLGRTLKYKDKRGRALDDLRSELMRLMTLLEGLRDADTPLRLHGNPAWAELVTQVREASRKSDLRKVEDQVDAVVCAYVALYAEREPKQVTTYGDLATGCIVTPSLPEGLTAAPRPTRAEAAHDRALTAYTAQLPALERASDIAVALVTGILDDAGINYLSISGRAKSVASFAGKAVDRVGDEPRYTDPLTEMADQVGRPHRHLPAERRGRGGRRARQPVPGAGRPRQGPGDGEQGPLRLREPPPRPHARPRRGQRRRDPRTPAWAAVRGADPHRAPARLGGVRARHPLQGHDPRRSTRPTSTAG